MMVGWLLDKCSDKEKREGRYGNNVLEKSNR